MNSLKNVAMVAILALVAYAVYVSINSSPVQTPPEIAEDWTGEPPRVSLPGGDAGGASGFAMEGPSGFPSPGVPPIRQRSHELSPLRPFSESAPAPPFSPAPMPPEIAANLAPPPPAAPSDVPLYPSYAPSAPPIGSNANVSAGPPSPPLPDFNRGSAPPLPPESSFAPPGMNAAPTRDASREGISSYAVPGQNSPAKPNDSRIWPEFAEFLAGARRDLDQGRFRETLAILSSRYGEPDQTAAEAKALTDLLDQVAGTVIYSREHHLEPAYVVPPGETLPQIAEKYGVSPELLAKINGITDPMNLQPGRELKVLQGPFRAVVRLGNHEMEIWLHDLYAGRFSIGVGTDKPDLTGAFQVIEKNREPTYHSPSGRIFDPGDPLNPLGNRHIGLGDSVALHGTNDEASIGHTGGPGGIRLGHQDADNVFDILSLGSHVVIQR
jgi:lipoprotein-anchoring transpeptidase ErfK/SrfK